MCISPDVPLTLRFDTPPRSVTVEERERFSDVAPGKQSLTLVPPADLEAGERFRVEVCFADGAAPACATFHLVGHPALGMSQVKVFRQPRPPDSFQQGEKEAQARAPQCQEEVRGLRAERGTPEGLRGALASGLLGQGGIRFKNLTGGLTEAKGNALIASEVFSYRAEGRVAVEVWLVNPGTLPWTAAGAVLRGARGEVLKPLPPWQPEPVPPREEAAAPEQEPRRRVVVEVLATEAEARGTYTLGHVTFP